jgi:hydroxyacylglutathione hydrolase
VAGLTIEQIPVLSDNYIYLLHDPAGGATAAVDPAEAGPVEARLAERGWRLTHILNTHHHHDHVDGNLRLKRRFGCLVIGAERDRARIPGLDRGVGDGDRVEIGAATATVLDTPGHTIGHICYHFAGEDALFCGDTLFSLGCGRMFEGDPPGMWASLARLRALPADTRVYCAHEYTAANGRFAAAIEPDNPALAARLDEVAALRAAGRPTIPSRIGVERDTNPFLRADRPEMAAALDLPADSDPATVFATLRRRRDSF